jgi:DNA-binding transcriptional regulator YiaG
MFSLLAGCTTNVWHSLGRKGSSKMAKNFKELQAKMSPESRARSEAKAQRMIQEMALDELRAARALTQEHLPTILGVKQSAVSKLERRADMYVSTLRHFIEAMGGRLEIRAVFPDGAVRITEFQTLTEVRT